MDTPRNTSTSDVAADSNIVWDADPLVFNFHNEIPGKVKMHTRSLDLHNWVRIDKTYPAQMAERRRLWDQYSDQIYVSQTDASAEACKWELFETLVEYLPQRFPSIFEKRTSSIYNRVLNEEIPLERDDTTEDPLVRAGRLTQEDWVIIEWDDTEQGYKLTSGIVYFPMRWSLQDKFQKGVAGIHMPVKPFMDHLVRNVYDVFKKMKPENPLWRANWAVFNDLDGPLDLYTPTGSLSRNDENSTTVYEGDATGHVLTFRAEYQTLRKLPKTKCIVFGIRTYQRYLEEFKHLPVTDAQGLIKAVENLNEDFVMYKGARFWRDATIRYLQQDCIDGRLAEHENTSPETIMNDEDATLKKEIVGGERRIRNKSWFGVPPATATTVSVVVGVAVAGVVLQRLLMGRSSSI